MYCYNARYHLLISHWPYNSAGLTISVTSTSGRPADNSATARMTSTAIELHYLMLFIDYSCSSWQHNTITPPRLTELRDRSFCHSVNRCVCQLLRTSTKHSRYWQGVTPCSVEVISIFDFLYWSGSGCGCTNSFSLSVTLADTTFNDCHSS